MVLWTGLTWKSLSWLATKTSTSSVKIQKLLSTFTLNQLTNQSEFYAREAIKPLVDFIVSDAVLAVGKIERLERLYNELINKDWFMTLLDLEDYIKVKEQMLADYEDRDAWLDKVIVNISKAGFFSSDRTIAQYNEDIWHLN